MKTQNKLAVLLGAICVGIVIVYGISIYFFFDKYSYVDFYKRLETRVRITAKYNLSSDTLGGENLINLKRQHLEELENEKEYIIEVPDAAPIIKLAEQNALPVGFIEEIYKKGKAQAKNGNVFYAGSLYNEKGRQYIVVVSAENYYASHHLLFLRNIIAGSLLLVIIVVIGFSVYFARHIFDPIREITDKVKKISAENIHQRLDNNSYKNSSEIAALADTFNDLLNRIETSFETQKNFVGNASHELRTPLTSIIGEADVTLLKERPAEEYRKALQNILYQAERLDEISKSLLFLAQTGYKDGATDFVKLRVDEVLWESKALIDKLIPGNKIMVDLSLLPDDPKKLKVNGNKQLLNLAFSNLLNNACKYSNNQEVTVYIASSDDNVLVTIKDQGIGIPENEMPYIYDPFFRATNTQLFEGYGIGLPLARTIVHLHKGQLLVNSVVGVGTTVQVKIPVYRA